jgi:DNA-binding protein HU-beta
MATRGGRTPSILAFESKPLRRKFAQLMIRKLEGTHAQADVEIRTHSKNSWSAFQWSFPQGHQRVIESLADVGYKELKKTGAFFVPGFAKFVVIKKPATKARKGINPFTKEPTIFKAKPARKVIRARPVKAVKDAVA